MIERKPKPTSAVTDRLNRLPRIGETIGSHDGCRNAEETGRHRFGALVVQSFHLSIRC